MSVHWRPDWIRSLSRKYCAVVFWTYPTFLPLSCAMLVSAEPGPTTTSWQQGVGLLHRDHLELRTARGGGEDRRDLAVSVRSSAPPCRACNCLSPPENTGHWTW